MVRTFTWQRKGRVKQTLFRKLELSVTHYKYGVNMETDIEFDNMLRLSWNVSTLMSKLSIFFNWFSFLFLRLYLFTDGNDRKIKTD